MTDIGASLGEWADGARTLVVCLPEDRDRLTGLAGLEPAEVVTVTSLVAAFPAMCSERFIAVLLALPLSGEALVAAVEELRIVRRGPAIVVVGEQEDGEAALDWGADGFVPRVALTAGRLRRALSAGRDSGQRVQRLVGHLLHQRELVDSLLEGLIVISLAGRVLYVNARATELLGCRDEELLFRPFPVDALGMADESGTPLSADWFVSAAKLHGAGPVEHPALQLRRPDGEVLWVEVVASVLRRRADGVPYAATACFRDVTAERAEHAAHLAAERRQRRLLEHAADGYLVLDTDCRVIEASPAIERLLLVATVVGSDARTLVHPDDREPLLSAIAEAGVAGSSIRHLEVRLASPSVLASSVHGDSQPGGAAGTAASTVPESERWVEVTVTGSLADPMIDGVVLNLSEVTARKRAERARRFAEERFRLGFAQGTVGMAITDLHGRVLEVNPALCDLLDAPEEHLVGTMIAEWVHQGDRDHRLAMRRRLFAGDIDRYRSERRYVRRDGKTVWCVVNVSLIRDEHQRPLYLFSQYQDITERKSNEAVLEHRVHHDGLTGLPNRGGLKIRLDAALARAAERGTKVAVLFLDVDRFKVVNDGLGHAAGDVILVETARRLAAAMREGDTVARFGGDEFIVVCEDVPDLRQADVLARRTAQLFVEPIDVDGKSISVTASCGVVLVDGNTSAEEALRDADAAMYEAKDRGRNRPQLFDERLRRKVSERLDIEQALRRALERGELRLVYQPVVSLGARRTVGVEALVRWEHPERGTVSPVDFIPAAEESGLIVGVGEFVLDAALAQVARWRADLAECASLWVAVNFSSRQLSFGSPVATCERLLDEHQVPPDALHLELTESALMSDVETSVEMLEQLRSLGVAVAIDDFGTGYSSLAYLSRLPVSMLKIDRSFIAGIGSDPHASAIVRTIASLAHVMDLETCAEGVERSDQLAVVSKLGCELAQGYLWAPPLERDRLEAFIVGERSAPGPAPRAAAS